MAALLPNPVPQFCDANGAPYAGGSITSYVQGTTTPKQTWLDPGLVALNTNPIILDAAGRCVMYGDGDYRLILRDAAGNLIWDQPSSTIVSAAMEPVVSAPTIADAVNLLGLSDTTTAAHPPSAISTEQTARIAADTALGNEITTVSNNLATLTATVGNLQIETGGQYCDTTGHARISFANTYSQPPTVFATIVCDSGNTFFVANPSVQVDTVGFDIYWAKLVDPYATSSAGELPFVWLAVSFLND